VGRILAPSKFVKQKLGEDGWAYARIQVLPHFQTLPLTQAPYPGQEAPILYFGRLSTEKGLADLLGAMRQLSQIRLVIAVDGPQRSELEITAQKYGLGNVRFAGYVSGPALQKLIAESQFTIFPSHADETLGKSILESYAQARAVVASDLGSRRELVEEGKTGLLYPAGDVNQLAAAIKFLYERPELSRQMGKAGSDFVREQHSQAQHLLALERLYEQLRVKPALIGKRPKPPAPLRIAYIGGRGGIGKYSGIETYYEQTGKRLARTGHEITAYCRSYFTPEIAEHEVSASCAWQRSARSTWRL